jgi:hypothetical protein
MKLLIRQNGILVFIRPWEIFKQQKREHMYTQEYPLTGLSLHEVGSFSSSLFQREAEVACLRFSPDERVIASIMEASPVVFIWDRAQKELLHKFTPDAASVIRDLAFSPDGTLLAVAADTVTLWEPYGGHCVDRLPPFGKIRQVAFAPGGKELLLVDAQGKVWFWDRARQYLIASFQAIPKGSRGGSLAISAVLPCLALTNDTHQAFLWLFDSADGMVVPLATIPSSEGDGPVFSPDGKLFATLSVPLKQRKTHIQIYDIQSQAYTLDFVSPDPLIGPGRHQEMAFSADGTCLTIADLHGFLWFWNIKSQQLLGNIRVHADPGDRPYFAISALAWSPTGRYLATSGWEAGDTDLPGDQFIIKLWKVDQDSSIKT